MSRRAGSGPPAAGGGASALPRVAAFRARRGIGGGAWGGREGRTGEVPGDAGASSGRRFRRGVTR
jgi:hypothetical protein